jgi:hypothetical protein
VLVEGFFIHFSLTTSRTCSHHSVCLSRLLGPRSLVLYNQSINQSSLVSSRHAFTPFRPCNLLYTSLVDIFPAFFIVSTLGMNIYTLRGRPLHYPCHFIIKLSSSVQHYSTFYKSFPTSRMVVEGLYSPIPY